LRKAQLEITELKEDLREQKLKYTELEQSYKILKRSVQNEKLKGLEKSKDSILNDNEALISLHAHCFGVMNEIFVPKDVFLQSRPLNVSSDDLDWWDNDENAKRCIIAELYEEIPNSLHDMLEKTATFRDTV
jgi:hypothetical protein